MSAARRGQKGRAGSGPSLRTLKVGEAMRHALAELLTRSSFSDPALDGRIISISEVRVSPDLRHATAYVMPVGGTDEDEALVVQALNRDVRRLKTELAHRINTKYAADLHFRLDESFDEAARIDQLLRSPQVARDLREPLPETLDPEQQGEYWDGH